MTTFFISVLKSILRNTSLARLGPLTTFIAYVNIYQDYPHPRLATLIITANDGPYLSSSCCQPQKKKKKKKKKKTEAKGCIWASSTFLLTFLAQTGSLENSTKNVF